MPQRYEILLDYSSKLTQKVHFDADINVDTRNMTRILAVSVFYRNFAPEASRVAMKPTNRPLKYRWQRW